MKRVLVSALLMSTLLMLSGCGDSGTSSAATSATTSTSAVNSEDEAFFRQMYADDLYDKYNRYLNDSLAFEQVYYVENTEDADINAIIAAAERCISTLDAIIAIEPTEMLSSHHEKVIEGAEYEIKYYDIIRKMLMVEIGEQELSAQEIEKMSAFLIEYLERETFLLSDAYLAAFEAATGTAQ